MLEEKMTHLIEIIKKGAQKISAETLDIEIEAFIANYSDLRLSNGRH